MTPTIRHIAQACGLSTATVSRALNGHPRVRDDTRRLVLQYAQKLGWKPNPLVAAHMAHLRASAPLTYKATLGFLIDHPLDAMPGHIATIFQGASARAATYGYRLTPFSFAEEGMTPQKMDRLLYNRNIPGLLITSFRETGVRITDFNWQRYAAVAMGYTLVEPQLNRVMIDTVRGYKQCIDRIFALGYRRLGLVMSHNSDERVGHGVLLPAAYIQQRLAAGQEIQLLLLDSDEPREMHVVQRWLRAVHPDIVLGSGIAHDAARAMGWRVPQDIAYASLDRHPSFPQNAGFDQRHDMIGSLAVDVLVTQLVSNQRGVPAYYVEHMGEGRWVDGPSAPPVASLCAAT